MADASIRPATRDDLQRLTEIYNYYIVNTAITFDFKTFEVEERAGWFNMHSDGGRYRLLVAEHGGQVAGFANSHPFRTKQAYETTVETTIYCAPEANGKGVGSMLYGALFKALERVDINRAVAGITLPNDASIALHRKFGFTQVGVFTQNGRKFGRYWDVCWLEKALG